MFKAFRLLPIFLVFNFVHCSGFILKTFYANVDTLIIGELEDNFAFDNQTKKFAATKVTIHHTWHRYHELPRYADFCSTMADKMQKGLKPADIVYIERSLKQARYRMASRLVSDSINVFSDFSDQQVERQKVLFQKSNEEIQEELQDSAIDRQNSRIEKAVSFFEFFTGPLNSAQLTMIQDSVRSMPDYQPGRLAYRKNMQGRFLEILKKGDEKELEKFLKNVLIDIESTYPADYRAMRTATNNQWKKLLLDLDATLTDKQRQNAVESFRDLSQSFLELAGRSASASY